MIKEALFAELKHEAASTKKLLALVPDERLDWKPHEKSMALGRIATHIAEIPSYLTWILSAPEMDFASRKYQPHVSISREELLQIFEEKLQVGSDALEKSSDEEMIKPWTLRRGEHIIFTLQKTAAIRSLVMNHLVHHRGQLSVYLRLLDIPIPGMYGPSADFPM